MLKAVKGNKVYTISETEKKTYLEQGFDVYDGDKLIEHSPLKTIKFNEHVKITEELKAEIKTLKAEIKTLKAENEALKAESANTKKGK